MKTGLKIADSSLKAALLKKTGKRKGKLKAATGVASIAASAAKNDLVPDLSMEIRDIAGLKGSSRRVRKERPEQQKALIRSIVALGFHGAILVAGDTIIDGHNRVAALKQLGATQVRAIEVGDMSSEQRSLLAISMNRIAETGEWAVDMLRELVVELDLADYDLGATGFTDVEIDLIKLDPLDGDLSELDQLPDVDDKFITSVKGDLWALGKHRLLCGSAREPADYVTLMNGDMAAAMITDPPWNLKIEGVVSGLGKVKHGDFAEAAGELSNEEFSAFLTSFFSAAGSHIVERGVAMAFIDWRQVSRLEASAIDAGFRLINMAVWDKGTGGMGGLYRSAHELVPVFCKGATTPLINNVKLGVHGRDRTNVWAYPGATRRGSSAAKALKDHPTPKNVAMIVDAMLDVTNAGDIVLDPFLGSGTTIIAAEEVGRVARTIELDPKYVDLAVRRWTQLTGGVATLAATGESFAEITQSRQQAATQEEG